MKPYTFDKLTRAQKEKWARLLESFPEFGVVPQEKVFTSAELSKIFRCRSDHVLINLRLISKRIGCQLRVQIMMKHRGGFSQIESEDIRKMSRKKGTSNKRWFKDHGFKGTSQWIRLFLE